MASSSIWTVLAQGLRQPTAIAAYASVGMHAMLGVALPTIPWFADVPLLGDTSTTPRNQVNLIELSAADFNRLPLAVTMPQSPLGDLPELPMDTMPGAMPNIANLPTPTPSNTPNRPNFPPLGNQVQRGATQRGATPPAQDPLYSYGITPTPQTRNNTNRAIPPNTPPRPTDRRISGNSPNQNQPTPQDRRIPHFEVADENPNFQLQEFDNPADLLRRPSGADQLARRNPPNPEQAAILVPSPGPEKAPGEGSTATESETLAARREESVLSDIEQRRENLRSNPINTTEAEAEENNARWLAAAVVEPRALTVAGNYPQDACLRRLSGTTVYGVEVRPDGGKGEPQLLQSAGHKIFNDQARSQLTAISFPAVNRPTPFRVTVTFNYNPETCPALAVPEATPEPNPTPEPTTPRPTTPLPAPPTEE